MNGVALSLIEFDYLVEVRVVSDPEKPEVVDNQEERDDCPGHGDVWSVSLG